MATVVLVQAVNNNGMLSSPIKVYLTEGHRNELPSQFVLRLKDGKDREGRNTITVGNFGLHMVGTHNPDYLVPKLAGFRRKLDDAEVILCQLVEDEVIEPKDVQNLECY